jgi:hypothetical protein
MPRLPLQEQAGTAPTAPTSKGETGAGVHGHVGRCDADEGACKAFASTGKEERERGRAGEERERRRRILQKRMKILIDCLEN